ncbi:MAG: hypothetical protein ACKPKO_64745, partial [Candidatus Fonsibacter sp.]
MQGNRAAGVGILLHREFKERDMRRTWAAAGIVEGRGLAARVKRATFDICPVALYFPVQPSRADQQAPYRAAVKGLTVWLEGIVNSLPKRCTPIICVDLHNGMGIQRQGREWAEVESTAVGIGATRERRSRRAGEAMRTFCERQHL